jgi:hypothetical protein
MNANETKKRLASRDKAENGVNPILAKHFAKRQRIQALQAAVAALTIALIFFLLMRK